MLNDFDLIVRKFPENLEEIHIYPLGDVHVGSQEFDEEHWRLWKRMVLQDPVGYVVIIGDMVDNGLRNSKTNPYESTMRPREQKEWLTKELRDLKDRIIGACRGNHENRSVKESDDCPLYDIMSKLDLEDLYRENSAFVKVNVGRRNTVRQCSYIFALMHGSTRNKAENFGYAIDGVDVYVTGHTHTPTSTFPSKIVIDVHNECVREVGLNHVVVPSFLKSGGYGLNHQYMPQNNKKIPIIILSGTSKKVEVLWTE